MSSPFLARVCISEAKWTTLSCVFRPHLLCVQNIQTLVIAAAIRRLGWKGVAVLRSGWGKAFVDQLLTLKVGIVGEVVSRDIHISLDGDIVQLVR